MLSVLELPVSLVSATVGAAGAVVSRVNVKRAGVVVALFGSSTWRTSTVFAPSTALKVLVQVAPPLDRKSVCRERVKMSTAGVPLMMMRSVLELPVSLVSATVGAAGAVVSRMKLKLAGVVVAL